MIESFYIDAWSTILSKVNHSMENPVSHYYHRKFVFGRNEQSTCTNNN